MWLRRKEGAILLINGNRMSGSKQQSFIKGSAILIASNMIIKGINFLLLPLYTKYLTPEMLGISDSISNFTAILFPLLVMGLDSAFSAFYFDKHDENHHHKVMNTIRITMLIASLVPVLMAAASKPFALLLFGDSEYYMLVVVSLISVSFNLWHLPFSLLARMRNRMALFALVNTSASIAMIFLNVLFLTGMHLGAYSLILSTACVQLLQFVMYRVLMKERLDSKAYDRDLLKRMMTFSLPLIPNALATWVLALSDRYIILHYCGTNEVGLYGIAARFAAAVSLVANGIYMAYTTYAYGKKGDADDRQNYSRILNAFVYAIMGICVTISLFAREVIDIMTDSSYADTAVLIAPILFGQLLYGINTLVGYAITFEKKSKYILLITTSGAVMNVILNFAFVPNNGALAASYTTLASYILMVVLTYYYAQKTFPVEYQTMKLALSIIVALGISCISIRFALLPRVLIYVAMVAAYTYLFKDSAADYLNQATKIVNKVWK